MNKSTFAKIAESLAGTFSKLTFSPPTQQYQSGEKVVLPDTVRVIVDKQIAASGAKMEAWGDELKAVKGQPGWEAAVDRWAVQFREERRALTLQCASSGRGGLHATTMDAYDRAESVNKYQFERLDEIVATLKADPDYVDSGTFALHGDRFARTSRHSYENERVTSHKEVGFKWKIRWTHSSEPCTECHALDGKARKIDEGPAFGECICNGACECTEELFVENPDD